MNNEYIKNNDKKNTILIWPQMPIWHNDQDDDDQILKHGPDLSKLDHDGNKIVESRTPSRYDVLTTPWLWRHSSRLDDDENETLESLTPIQAWRRRKRNVGIIDTHPGLTTTEMDDSDGNPGIGTDGRGQETSGRTWTGNYVDTSNRKLERTWTGNYVDTSYRKLERTWTGDKVDTPKLERTWTGDKVDTPKLERTWTGDKVDTPKLERTWTGGWCAPSTPNQWIK